MKPSKTEARWRRLVAEQERSGQSVREFAEEKGVSAWSLYGWRSRLGVTGGPKRSGRQARRRDGAASEVEFIAVDVVDEESAQLVGAPLPLEVEIGDMLVRVPNGFDAGEIGRLVSVLRASC